MPAIGPILGPRVGIDEGEAGLPASGASRSVKQFMGDDDPRLREAVMLFNQREFFACHDVLEEIWSETLEEREFYQGLIHAAVALFHFGEGNLGGARKMAGSTLRYLEPYRPECRAIDVERLMDDFQRCFAELLGPHAGYPAGLTLDEARIPVIQLRDA